MLVRALLAGFLMMLALTSCTGSLTPDKPAEPEASPAPDHTPTPERSPTTSMSLPCPHGMQRRLIGVKHNIIGAVFAPRLVSPPSQRYANKILWSSEQTGSADLLISASLNGSTLRVDRRVEGNAAPGSSRPSIIDVPKAGCWTFSLRWGETSDVVAVLYSGSR